MPPKRARWCRSRCASRRTSRRGRVPGAQSSWGQSSDSCRCAPSSSCRRASFACTAAPRRCCRPLPSQPPCPRFPTVPGSSFGLSTVASATGARRLLAAAPGALRASPSLARPLPPTAPSRRPELQPAYASTRSRASPSTAGCSSVNGRARLPRSFPSASNRPPWSTGGRLELPTVRHGG